MSESEVSHFSIQDLSESLTTRLDREAALQSVDADPEQAARILWFQLHNGSGEGRFEAAVPLLKQLGSHESYRGAALELLGVVCQKGSEEACQSAETAARSVLRTKRS